MMERHLQMHKIENRLDYLDEDFQAVFLIQTFRS